MSKGVLITVSTFLLLMALLVLSGNTLSSVVKGEQDLGQVGTLDRVNYKFSNIEDNYLDIRSKVLGLRVEVVDGNTLCFFDKLPNANFQKDSPGQGNKVTRFETDLSTYEKFVKLYPDALNVNFDATDVNVLDISAYPLNLDYSYEHRIERQINIGPNTDIAGIDINVVLVNQDFDEVNYASPKNPETTPQPGFDLVRLHVYEAVGSPAVFDNTVYLDPTLNNKIRVETKNEDPPLQHNFMTLQWKDEVIQLISTPSQFLELKVCIIMDADFIAANGSPEITLPPGVLSVSDDDFNVLMRS